jgi:hypothetical protein
VTGTEVCALLEPLATFTLVIEPDVGGVGSDGGGDVLPLVTPTDAVFCTEPPLPVQLSV